VSKDSIFHHSRFQKLPDQFQNLPVRDPVLHDLSQRPVIDRIKEPLDVCVDHPIHLPGLHWDAHHFYGIVRSPVGPEPEGVVTEVRLVNWL
jgi:hypothetical protein